MRYSIFIALLAMFALYILEVLYKNHLNYGLGNLGLDFQRAKGTIAQNKIQ